MRYAHIYKKQGTIIMSTMLNMGVYKLGVFMEGDYNRGWYLKSILYTIYIVSTKIHSCWLATVFLL